ncbi:GNAT family N-acetyltransferase [Leptobacterium flavescens]|uniref:GNAT family N-acetyltransferase n=1 Tax=Leptobacterium flavescens TaxID=472055 RepID=A0A6P0USF2_9FLAO|nr:GNAT family N-acetyltransferase [Leptobacterium flavescens]NER15472.1 GNAT family N-acetyltransferase [Leptobacterium flavescens]
MIVIETERLYLRELERNDHDFLLRLMNSPGWLKFIGDRGVKTPEDAINYIEERFLKSYQTFGYGLYLMEAKADKTALGICGLVKREHLEYPDIGFALMPEFEGNGFALEAAQATMKYAKKELKLEKIAAITDQENERSIHLLKKLEMEFDKMIPSPGEDSKIMLFINSS